MKFLRLFESFETSPPDPEWVARAQKNGFTKNSVYPDRAMEKLKRKLLDCGGWGVALRSNEPDYDALMQHGRLESGAGALFRKMAPINCHQNVENLYLKNPTTIRAITGWALSHDGMWRQHSWAKKGNRIIETTVPRVAYFGVDITALVEPALRPI